MKKSLLAAMVLFTLVGTLGIVLFVLNGEAGAQAKRTALVPLEIMTSLPREAIKSEGAANFTPVARSESDSLAMQEDSTLLSLSGGAFNPEFEALSSSEQKTLKTCEEQKPDLQNMTAGDSGSVGIGLGTLLLVLLCLVILF